MTKKVYGVNDLKEWTVNIKCGKATLRVSFEGGSSTLRGTIPATYATTDPVKQAIIEKSDYFKHGRIYVVQKMEVPDDASARARKMRNKKVAPVAGDGANGSDGSDVQREPEEGVTVRHVTVADKADAVEWLKENYPDKGYTANKLRTADAFNAACEECGVVFDFK